MPTRQELYDRIRSTSKDEVILEEMIRLGFWKEDSSVTEGPENEIRRLGELEREIRKLTTENRQLQNVETIKRQQRQQRLEASKKRRQENKERRLREREERAKVWSTRKKSEIIYLGQGYSGALDKKQCDVNKLQALGLAHLTDEKNLAHAMGIDVGLLRFLAFGRKTSKTTHYRRFLVAKKTGGHREISAPMPRLKIAQRWILDNILQEIAIDDAAHGFRPERSIVTNAQPHVGAKVVINMDMENFFPTVTYRRIKGVFRSIGFSESLSAIMTMLCSESNLTTVEVDGETFFVSRGERYLPQGAPTSPAITNLICRGLDARLTKIAQQLGFTYTRYADDITFSSRDPAADVGRAIRRIKHAVTDESFVVHPDKTRVLRAGSRLEVTGLTVNQKVSVSRRELRKFRAALHQIETEGPEGKSWGNTENVIAAIDGYAKFVAMVDPQKGQRFQAQVDRIIEMHGQAYFEYTQRDRWREKVKVSNEPTAQPPVKNEAPSKKKKPWWKIW